MVGSQSKASVELVNRTPIKEGGSDGGGGSFGWLAALLLGVAGAMRRMRLQRQPKNAAVEQEAVS